MPAVNTIKGFNPDVFSASEIHDFQLYVDGAEAAVESEDEDKVHNAKVKHAKRLRGIPPSIKGPASEKNPRHESARAVEKAVADLLK